MLKSMRRNVHVNIPCAMLAEGYLERFIDQRLNPEIGFDAAVLDRFPASLHQETANRLQQSGLAVTLHGPFMDLSPGSPDSRVRELTRYRFGQFLELLPVFRPRHVVCHAGYDEKRYGPLKETWLAKSLETWRWLAAAVREQGARLMLENVYEKGPQEMATLLAQLEDLEVGFCLDSGHQAAFSSTSLGEWLDALGPRLQQLHLHDNCGAGDEHLALGKGVIDFRTLLKRVGSLKQEPLLVTLEPHREADLRPSLEALARIWPWPDGSAPAAR